MRLLLVGLVGLGFCFGAEPDKEQFEAVKWLRLAAEQGDADAQFRLGVMYDKGQGVPQDYVQAHKWLNSATSRASAEKNKEYASARDAVEGKMTVARIVEALRLAREWKPKTWEELKGQQGSEKQSEPTGVDSERDSPGVGPGSSGGTSGELSRVGEGVTAPKLTYKVEPEYSKEAREAKLGGTVVLAIEVWEDGKAHNIRVRRSLGLGLDEKAIEAVEQWMFVPGEKGDVPVKTRANVEVNFRLVESDGSLEKALARREIDCAEAQKRFESVDTTYPYQFLKNLFGAPYRVGEVKSGATQFCGMFTRGVP